MDLQSRTTIPFGDGEYTFALRCRELENLEIACKASISEIATRVIGLRPTMADIKNIITMGLEGGGLPSVQAAALYSRYVDGVPLFRSNDPGAPALVAAQVMEAAWFGVAAVLDDPEGNPGGKPQAEGPTAG